MGESVSVKRKSSSIICETSSVARETSSVRLESASVECECASFTCKSVSDAGAGAAEKGELATGASETSFVEGDFLESLAIIQICFGKYGIGRVVLFQFARFLLPFFLEIA